MSKNAPEIRFKGFEGEWEEDSMANLASFDKGHGYSKNDLKESGTPIILYGRLYTKFQSSISEIDTFAEAKDFSVFSKGGEVIVPASGESPEDIARASVVKNNGVILGGDINIVTPKEQLDSLFLALNITYGSSHNKLALQSQGATISHLHNGDIQKVDIKHPSQKKEQSKIGSYFEQMDALIEGKQKKLKKLKNLKKAYLDKMFPKKGAKVPEVRFKGFSSDWEEKSFSTITFKAGEKNKENKPLESYSISNEKGFVPQNEQFENGGTMRDADKSMYIIVPPNSFAYNPARINIGSIGYQNIGHDVIVSSLYEVFQTSEECDDAFLWHWFKTPHFSKMVEAFQEGGVRLYFYYDKLCMGKILLPTVPEQRKIAQFFTHLGNLITLQQQELEKLKNIKSACLQKMFV